MKSKKLLLLAFCLTSIAPAARAQSINPPAETKPPRFDLDQYQFGMLTRGPRWTADNTPEIQKIQEGHMANINKMAQLGKLMAAGPIADNGDLRGIFIFRAASIDEAKGLAAEDPAIIGVYHNQRIKETIKLQIGADFQNAFNTPQLNDPITSIGDANFGKIIGDGNQRQIQISVRLSY